MNAARAEIAELVRARLDARVVVARDDGSARDFEDLPRFAGLLHGRRGARRLPPGRRTTWRPTCSPTARPAAFSIRPTTRRRWPRWRRPARGRSTPSPTTAASRWRWRARVARCWRSTRARPPSRAPPPTRAATVSPTCTVERANAFDLLRALEARGERFDVVVIDPPALAKRGGAAALAHRGPRLQGADPARRAPDPAGRAALRLLVLGPRHPRALGGDLHRGARRRGPPGARRLAGRRRPRSPRALRRPRDRATSRPGPTGCF